MVLGAGRTELPLCDLGKEVRSKSGEVQHSSHYKVWEPYSGSEIGSTVGM